MFYFYVLLAIMAGVSVVISRIYNSRIAKEIGTFQGIFVNYVTGLISSFLLFMLTKDYININPIQIYHFMHI